MSMKKDLAGFKQSALDEIDAAFDAAKKKAVEAVGIFGMRKKGTLSLGVMNTY